MKLIMGNIKIGGKIISGVILILLLATIMGGIALYNMRGISQVLNRVTSQNAPSVEYANGVERYALRTILNEKNYLLYQEKKIHQQAMQDISKIYAYLDKVDKVAKQYGDEGLLQKSKEVRSAVRQYQAHYNKGVTTIEENAGLVDIMRQKYSTVNELANVYIADKDKEMAAALKTEIGRKELVRIIKALSVSNEIWREALETRRQEKNYILYGKVEYFNKLKEHVANLMRLYDELEFVSTTSAARIKISQAREATKEYLAAANNWVTNDQKLKALLVKMRDLGINVQETAMAAQKDGWESMSESKRTVVSIIRGAFVGTISALIIMIIVGIIAAILLARFVTRPVEKMLIRVQELERAEGDLTQRIDVKSEDEIGDLGKAFNKMLGTLHDMIFQIKESATKVSATSQELSSSAQEMNATTEEVSSTVQQIATGSTKQAEATEKTSKIVEDISTVIKQNTSAAQTAAAASLQATEKAQEGRSATQKTVEKMEQIDLVINESVNSIRGLKDRSQQIGRIVEVITGFANQTNLLSLNAAIEAARAGESGRGFAVVAEEVRKLAEGSKKSAEEISDLIAEIQAETEKTATSIDSGSKEVTEGMEVVKETRVAFEEIVRRAEEVSAMCQQVASASQQVVEGTEKIVKSMEEISATAEESASAVQEVSASTEEQTSSMEEMASSAQELSDMAIKLAELTAKFKVGGDKDVRR
jgi:methyl-accepting chemotaxis protein